ncbi:carboxylesterase family [Fusarium beomiforme]|uniref:Carboxylic ester hydrolase n=1 Tax=Fusarium beomiforme TaxID=44412 RepID=A0A9P5A3R1_9HYPO|nr:carboxylesterase family [Fusarium beomiforme]
MRITFLISFSLFTWAAVSATPQRGQNPFARTKQGTFAGIQLNNEVDAFLGVPYAEPPVGPLRFLPPQPVKGSKLVNKPDVYNATQFSPVCYQFNYRSVLGDATLPRTEESEDCLTLNVFVPRKAACGRLLPVFIWSFGGAFAEGGGSIPLYNPMNFVAESKDIIVVTWNYRLNIFGFPNSPALDAQNLGLRDQRAALEWLRDNIADFGGDPKRMVLGGQSAGADAGHAMLYSHSKDPIVSAIAMQSGTVQVIGAASENVDAEFIRVAETVGCRDSANRTKELACMRQIDAHMLKHAVSNNTVNYFGSPPGGSPMIDNVTLFTVAEYMHRGQKGIFAKVPTLMGMMDAEVDGVLNWDAKAGVNRILSNILTITLFNCNIALESSFRALNSVPVWRYRYMGVFPEVTPYSWLRAYHVADVPVLFGSEHAITAYRDSSDLERKHYRNAARIFRGIFANFIRDPFHGLRDTYNWPIFSPHAKTLMELFRNNSATMSLSDPNTYDKICEHPPRIPWELFDS